VSLSTSPLTRAQAARIRNLSRDKQMRQAEGAFIVEGAKPVRDLLLNYPEHLQLLVMAAAYQLREQGDDRAIRASVGVPSYCCADHTFATMSDLDAPPGIMAVVRQPSWNEDELFNHSTLFGVYGEELQDPANVGAIIRTAAALNVSALWLTPGSADVYNPKVVRATSGALLSLPVFVAQDATVFAKNNCALFASETGMRKTVQMESIQAVPQRMVLAVGNESRGLSTKTTEQAACRFTIPLSRQVESLNVAATAAIAIYYLGHLPKESEY